jgi:hypothetical protein
MRSNAAAALAAPFLELRRFSGEFVAPVLLANFFEFTEALLDAFDLGDAPRPTRNSPASNCRRRCGGAIR